MRYKRIQLSIILLLGLGLTGMQAQILLLNLTNGNQTQYVVSEIHKITFSEDSISIAKTSGLLDDYSLSVLRFLSFVDDFTGMEVTGHEKRRGIIQLYPNPVGDYITIVPEQGKDAFGVIEILTPKGLVIFKEQIVCKQKVTLDLGALSHGIYFCRYRTGITIKTSKFIKL